MKRVTPAALLQAFAASGKRHLLLTGDRKSGKTTLLSGVFPGKQPGFTTYAVPKEGVWLRDNLTEEACQIGIFDPSLTGPENRMRPTEGLTAAAETIRRLAQSEAETVVLDEIGYLESEDIPFQQAVLELFEKKQVIAVIRKQAIPFLQSLLGRDDAFTVDLDAPYGNLGCVIMASGLGRRFGANKLMAPFRGKPLVQWVLEATDGIFVRRVVVTRHKDVANLCEKLGVSAILHDLPNRNDTIRLGLKAVEDTDGCLLCPADQPLLSWNTVAAMALSHDGSILRAGGKAPVLFPKQTYGELLTLPEGKGGRAVIHNHPEQVKILPVSDPRELMDTDTPEELQKLEKDAE